MSEHPLAAPLHSIARACTSWGDHSYAEACRQAAATLTQQMRTITSLEAEARQSAAAREAQHREIGRLRAALEPLADIARQADGVPEWDGNGRRPDSLIMWAGKRPVTLGHARVARAVLESPQ